MHPSGVVSCVQRIGLWDLISIGEVLPKVCLSGFKLLSCGVKYAFKIVEKLNGASPNCCYDHHTIEYAVKSDTKLRIRPGESRR